MVVSYDFKANLTTILSTYLIPLLIGYGFSEATSSAIVGLIVSGVIIGFGMLNEMYTSKHLTKDKKIPTVDDLITIGVDTDDEPVYDDEKTDVPEIPEFESESSSELPEFESESVSLSRLE